VREGLWKTEKALADLELREYDHGKKIASSRADQNKKFSEFKTQMESAITLIHQIQAIQAPHSQPFARSLRAVI
jgi:hypothetical protein